MNEDQIVCDVETTMKYVVRGEKATFHAGDRARSYWPVDEHPVTIHDVRPIRDRLSFDRNGFVLVDEPTDVTEFCGSELERYQRQVEALVQRLTGADKVVTPAKEAGTREGARSGMSVIVQAT